MPDTKTPIPQTAVQYGSHDKEQNTNATFVNTEITENGIKLDLEKLGINTDITKVQVVTKDEVVDQINTVIHTDLLNETTRNQVIKDVKGLINTPGDIIVAIQNSKGDQNFLDELKGTIGKSDIIAELENHKELKDKAKELKAKDKVTTQEVESYLTSIAQIAAKELGSEKKVIVKIIEDDSIGAGAHLSEDGKTITIYANLNDYADLDMYSSLDNLMKEVYHDNAINPYTYNKTEAQMRADKDKSLQNKEEGATQTIGDYKSKDKGEKTNWNDKLVDNGKLALNTAEYEKNKELGLLEFDDIELRSREKAKDLYKEMGCATRPNNEECRALKKEIDKTIYTEIKPKIIEYTEKSTKSIKIIIPECNSDCKIKKIEKIAADKAVADREQQNYIDLMNNYEKMKDTDYLTKGYNYNLDLKITEDMVDGGLSFLAEGGESMLGTGIPIYSLIGVGLMIPETVKDAYDGIKALGNKDYDSAIKYGGLIFITGVESLQIRQGTKSTVKEFTEVELDGK